MLGNPTTTKIEIVIIEISSIFWNRKSKKRKEKKQRKVSNEIAISVTQCIEWEST